MGKKGEYEGWKLKEKFALVYSAESAKMRLQEEPMIAKILPHTLLAESFFRKIKAPMPPIIKGIKSMRKLVGDARIFIITLRIPLQGF